MTTKTVLSRFQSWSPLPTLPPMDVPCLLQRIAAKTPKAPGGGVGIGWLVLNSGLVDIRGELWCPLCLCSGLLLGDLAAH